MTAEHFRQIRRDCPRGTLISVHRGLWGQAPENSLAAIKAAHGFGVIEIDAQLASDGVPVVIHDPDLTRTTGLPLQVDHCDHKSLTEQFLLTGLGGPDAKMTDQKLPTLQAALNAAGPGDYFDIDVKREEQLESVAAAIAKAGQQACGALKMTTQTAEDIDKLLALQDRHGVTVMAKVVISDAGLDHICDLTEAGVAGAEVWYDSVKQLSQACRIGGARMAISTYTLDPVHCCDLSDARALQDPEAVWGTLIEAGVSVIMTDHAATLAAYLEQRP